MFFYGDSHIMRKPAGDCTLAITTSTQSMASGLARQGGVSTPAGGLDHSGRATSRPQSRYAAGCVHPSCLEMGWSVRQERSGITGKTRARRSASESVMSEDQEQQFLSKHLIDFKRRRIASEKRLHQALTQILGRGISESCIPETSNSLFHPRSIVSLRR